MAMVCAIYSHPEKTERYIKQKLYYTSVVQHRCENTHIYEIIFGCTRIHAENTLLLATSFAARFDVAFGDIAVCGAHTTMQAIRTILGLA